MLWAARPARRGQETTAMKQENLEKIIQLRHRLHMHPELSMKETWTKLTLMEFLKENTKLVVADRGRWFYAYYDCQKEGAEAIAFRADFDALPMEEKPGLPYGSKIPGVCHKCGHDGHSAALAGLALEVDQSGAEKSVFFIFQHGEEVGGGGAECAKLLAEKGIFRVFAFHNMSGFPRHSILVKPGVVQCTSKGLTVHMKGRPAHASQPEDGKNPAAALAELVLYQEQQNQQNACEGFALGTVVHMTAGSKNFGIAAAEGEVSLTLRADYEKDMELLEDGFREYAAKLAREQGLEISFEESDFFPETDNDPEAVGLVRQAAKKLGFPVIEMERPFRASEDFGYYLKECPGAIFYIGNGEAYPQIHTADYDFPDEILGTAVDMFLALVG